MSEKNFILQESVDDHLTVGQIIGGVKQRYKMIIILVAIALVGSLSFVLTKRDYFKSKAVLTSPLLQASVMEPVLTSLEQSVDRTTPESFSALTGMSIEHVGSVQSIRVEDLQSGENQDYIFSLEVVSTDSGALKAIHNDLLSYIRAVPYFKKRKEQRIREVKSLIFTAEEQLKEMYALKEQAKASGQNAKGVIIYPMNIHESIVDMEERVLSFKEELNDLSIATYIQEPVIPDHPSGPKRMLIVLLSVVLASVIGVVFSIAAMLY